MSRKRGLGVGLLILVAVVGGFLLLRQFPVFGAGDAEDGPAAVLQIGPPESSQPGTGEPDFKTYLMTQAALIKNPRILAKVLDDPHVKTLEAVKRQSDPVNWLEERLRVSFPPDTYLMIVSMDGTDPKTQATLINAVVRLYLEIVNTDERYERQDHLEQLKSIRAGYEEKLQELRGNLLARLESFGAEDAKLSDLTEDLRREALRFCEHGLLENTIEGAEVRVRRDRREAVEDPDQSVRDETERLEERIAVLDEQARALRAERDRLLDEAREAERATREVSNLRGDIARMEEVLKKVTEEIQQYEFAQSTSRDRDRVISEAAARS